MDILVSVTVLFEAADDDPTMFENVNIAAGLKMGTDEKIVDFVLVNLLDRQECALADTGRIVGCVHRDLIDAHFHHRNIGDFGAIHANSQQQRQRIGQFYEGQTAGIARKVGQGLFQVAEFPDQVHVFASPRAPCPPKGWFRSTVLASII